MARVGLHLLPERALLRALQMPRLPAADLMNSYMHYLNEVGAAAAFQVRGPWQCRGLLTAFLQR